ncbi:unnamed protein product [Parnassius apollo]|uniref:(apollo) hypothetical protein n=1 Tax=Parnassius apollo TaxID=110799 RepID=A0A8S3XN51_PARAO|nr:unnamed protein product [Parnassius apollo]
MHLIACRNNEDVNTNDVTKTNSEVTVKNKITSKSTAVTSNIYLVDSAIECTWMPSEKTKAATHYYAKDYTPVVSNYEETSNVDSNMNLNTLATSINNDSKSEDLSDDKIADNVKKGFLLALVKIQSLQDVTFGCVLTIISEYWTLTAASCIESIEEVDALDSFVMLEEYGEKNFGKTHTVSDVLIHPEYQGINKNYDITALKSEDKLLKRDQPVVKLPTVLEFLMVTIGEQLSLLGYGKFREGMGSGEESRAAREVHVHRVAGAQCAAAALRHLMRPAPAPPPTCAAPPLCARPVHLRAPPPPPALPPAPDACYCGGALLLRGTTALGVQAGPCAGCEPALYVSLAHIADWIHALIADAL